MNSVDVYIVVEGPTEQTFVRDVLAPQMGHGGIYLHPVLIGNQVIRGVTFVSSGLRTILAIF